MYFDPRLTLARLDPLRTRRSEPEVMDQPDLDPLLHRQALAGLARVNLVSHTAGICWKPIKLLARRRGISRLSVLDLAAGGGDVTLGLYQRAAKAGLQLDITAYDLSPTAVAEARQRASEAGAPIRFEVRDILAPPWDEKFDVVVCTLFLHHLDSERAVALLRRMAAAAKSLVLVNDLTRGLFGYLAAHVVCRTITRSGVVRIDGPRSVAGAFRIEEVRQMAERAGLHGISIRNVWPFRFLFTWEPP